MDLIGIYQCLCDRTRLRVLNLLHHGPLCVCHFQEVLGESQVKISKHLGYLKRNGMVEAERCANWMVYHLPENPPAMLRANLACLQDCLCEDQAFRDDLGRLEELRNGFGADCPECVRKAGLGCPG